ncbi:hypothetical protein [Oerskovia sp. Root22]|uniref:hypothetical protein n=1 Tax=Oerskovia sp. Root22 TaxID=1736494 RepID=UPI000B21574E|nr:hypothetical protein [Oerskovia sp. Root22]
MAKMSLTSLLDGASTQAPHETAEINEPITSPPTPAMVTAPEPPPASHEATPVPAPAPVTTPPANSGRQPNYLALERKETRLRFGQLDDLTEIRRRLNKNRQGRGERLTENTLIRIAIDLLLTRANDLAGSTEAELRKSVGLSTGGRPPRRSADAGAPQ